MKYNLFKYSDLTSCSINDIQRKFTEEEKKSSYYFSKNNPSKILITKKEIENLYKTFIPKNKIKNFENSEYKFIK